MKINQYSQKEKQKEFEQNLSFQEWLNYFQKEPTIKELDEMEKDINKHNKQFFNPLNNTSYHPLQGA